LQHRGLFLFWLRLLRFYVIYQSDRDHQKKDYLHAVEDRVSQSAADKHQKASLKDFHKNYFNETKCIRGYIYQLEKEEGITFGANCYVELFPYQIDIERIRQLFIPDIGTGIWKSLAVIFNLAGVISSILLLAWLLWYSVKRAKKPTGQTVSMQPSVKKLLLAFIPASSDYLAFYVAANSTRKRK